MSIKKLFYNKFFILGSIILFLIFLLTLLGGNYTKIDLDNKFSFNSFILGSDHLGRSLFYRIVQGIKTSLAVGFFSILLELFIGIVYGSFSAFSGEKIDFVMSTLLKSISSIPHFIYILLFLTFCGSGILSLILAISFTRWITMAMITRSRILTIKKELFIDSSRMLGANYFWILRKHIFPNIIDQVVVRINFSFSKAIFYEAMLSFLGIGITPPNTSLGRLILDGFNHFNIAPYLFYIPSIFLFLLILSFNLIANGIRESK